MDFEKYYKIDQFNNIYFFTQDLHDLLSSEKAFNKDLLKAMTDLEPMLIRD